MSRSPCEEAAREGFARELPFGAWDGHTHSCGCPHGAGDPTSDFVERAIELGFQRYSITEHAPFPVGFQDPSPIPNAALAAEALEPYLREAEALRARYADRIEVCVGLEVDYVAGFETQTRELLELVGPRLDDALLSVHLLRLGDRHASIDFSLGHTRDAILPALGGVEAFHAAYWAALEAALEADLGPHKPRRLGHLTLAHKYRVPLGEPALAWTLERARPVLERIAELGYSLDLNMSRHEHPESACSYPPAELIREARSLGIPFVYGSDAHAARHVGRGLEAARTLHSAGLA